MGNIHAQRQACSGHFGAAYKNETTVFNGTTSEIELIRQQCPLSNEETTRLRAELIGRATTIFFKQDPLKIVRAKYQYLYDEKGIQYLDCINNVAHVGHCHPHVVDAVAKQFSMQCTNSRFLHDSLMLTAQRILATMQPSSNLRRCFFVNSGSEANDLAMRLAMCYTGRQHVIALDYAYHGHLTTLVHISPHIHRDLKAYVKPEWVHITEQPDPYRGKYRRTDFPGDVDDALLTAAYVNDFKKVINRINGPVVGRPGEMESKLCGFWAESMQSCAGQIVYPKNYLKQVFELVHRAGGVCIADEVQVGFGRCGTHFWAFQHSEVHPDIVVIGKSMGNGYPVAAVVCTEEIAAAFEDCGHEFFSTFGGNPGACAATLAVLDVIENEHLMRNAKQVGDYLLHRLQTEIQPKYPQIVGDVRGLGLFIGVELIKPPNEADPVAPGADEHLKLQPNRAAADHVVYGMRYRQIIVSKEGPDHNVIKIKPPMCFSMENADQFVNELDIILFGIVNGKFDSTGTI